MRYVGAIRALDITWGEAHGWHPHLHAVLLFEQPLSDEERAELLAWIHAKWSKVCADKGFGIVHPRYGVDLQAVRSASDVANYTAKVEGGWGAGLELARGDLKRSRADKGMTPWEILAELAETGETRWAHLWLEYEAATKGKRAIVWGRGLQERLGVKVDQTDEELAASEGADIGLLMAEVPLSRWYREVRTGSVAWLLDDFERLAVTLIALADILGHELVPIEPKGGPPDGQTPP
jgi:hypothetical protein